MLKLSSILAETEPDKAEKLRDAIERSGEKQIKRRLDQLVARLKSEQFSEADREQETVLADLEGLLDLLTNTLSDAERKRAERERLEAHKRAVQNLMKEEQEHLYRTQQAQADAERSAAIGKLADQLEELAQRQGELRKNGAKNPAAVRDQAKPQAELERETRAAAGDLKKLAETPADSKGADQTGKAESGQDGKSETGKNGKSGSQDKSGTGKDGQSGSQEKEGGNVGEAAQDADQAADAMQDAQKGMEPDAANGDKQTQPPGATEQAQKQAEEKLRRAVRRLREERKKLEEAAKLREIERLQRQTQSKTSDLQRDMEKKDNSSSNSPGADQVGKAAQDMQNAADRLGERQPREAQAQEKAATDKLQKALDELDDALRQVRREEIEEMLAALEARFRSMLAREQEVREVVTALEGKDAAARNRADELRMAENAQKQQQVAQDCRATLRILTEEGTTIIFPEVVSQMATDMEDVAQRLGANDVSSSTGRLLDDIIDQLKEILAAIEAKREQQQSDSDNNNEQQQQDNPNQPLLPGSAELKLLRSSQIRINQRTNALGDANRKLEEKTRVGQFEKLSERQRQLAELARKMNERQ